MTPAAAPGSSGSPLSGPANGGPGPATRALAAAKRLDPGWLASLGVRDGGGGSVLIDYRAPDGSVLYVRRRNPNGQGPRFSQPKGVSLAPYGQSRLGDARERGFVVVVEGESDTWALWAAGYPALGLPGSAVGGKLGPSHLERLATVYIALDNDAGGEGGLRPLLRRLAELGFRGEVRRVRLPDMCKDVSDMRAACPEVFAGDFQELLSRAERLELPPPGPTPRPLPPPPPPGAGAAERYAAEAVGRECEAVAGAPEGAANNQLNASAFSLGTLVGAGALARGEAESRLLAAAQSRRVPEGEARATIKSGLDAGVKQPRDLSEVGRRPGPFAAGARPRPPGGDGAGPPAAGAEATPRRAPGAPPVEIFTAEALMREVIPPARFVVPTLLTEGLCVVAGPPKQGKTRLMTTLSLDVAAGGRVLGFVEAEPGEVLYLALEDNKRRQQRRISEWCQGRQPPAGYHGSIRWPRHHEGGWERIAEWLDAHPAARMVVIDTWAKYKRPGRPVGNAYEDDYSMAGEVQRLALERRIAFVVVHHTKKGQSEDWVESISGSFGLAGAADCLLLFQRKRGEQDGVLHVTGRDLEEAELALAYREDEARWVIDGTAETARVSKAARQVIEAVAQAGRPVSPSEVATATGMSAGTVKSTLWRLSSLNVLGVDRGRYFRR